VIVTSLIGRLAARRRVRRVRAKTATAARRVIAHTDAMLTRWDHHDRRTTR
jgi:hypothetical protein